MNKTMFTTPPGWTCYVFEKIFEHNDLRCELKKGKVCLTCISEMAVKLKDEENKNG